jgi:valyl-tRNA synthetase
MKPQWWMKMRELADKAIEVAKNGEITIFPASEEKKYFRWMEGIDDWRLSRQLWWAHRVPAYISLSISFHIFLFRIRQLRNQTFDRPFITTDLGGTTNTYLNHQRLIILASQPLISSK